MTLSPRLMMCLVARMQAVVATVAVALLPLGARGQATTSCGATRPENGSHLMKALADVRWEGGGGFASAALEGDPARPGTYTMVVKLADGNYYVGERADANIRRRLQPADQPRP